MLEKDTYSQQDVDYAFSLSQMEEKKTFTGPCFSIQPPALIKA